LALLLAEKPQEQKASVVLKGEGSCEDVQIKMHQGNVVIRCGQVFSCPGIVVNCLC
jgi:hypothetical protein